MACGSPEVSAITSGNGTQESSTDNTNATDSEDVEDTNLYGDTDETSDSVASSSTSSDVDYDLTIMGADLVYATVYDMMMNPSTYEGKTVRMSGQYYASYMDDTQKYYMYCLISDAMGCCQSGMEFVWEDGSHVYPDEYPADYSEVEITGTYKTYTENGKLYCCITDASMTVL